PSPAFWERGTGGEVNPRASQSDQLKPRLQRVGVAVRRFERQPMAVLLEVIDGCAAESICKYGRDERVFIAPQDDDRLALRKIQPPVFPTDKIPRVAFAVHAQNGLAHGGRTQASGVRAINVAVWQVRRKPLERAADHTL